MLNIVLISVLTIYLAMAQCLLTRWLAFFKADKSMSVDERCLSLMTIIIATIAWPIVVPLSYLKLVDNQAAMHKSL